MNKTEKAIANAIKATKYEVLEALSGESLVTGAWVISALIDHAASELSKTNPKFDFVAFEEEASIEDE